LLREHPHLALAAGGVALVRLTELPDVDLGVLEAIEVLVPFGRHVDLDIATAVLTARLTPHHLATTTDPANRAQLYAILGYRLMGVHHFSWVSRGCGRVVRSSRRWVSTRSAGSECET
jgi:hypothetical protein